MIEVEFSKWLEEAEGILNQSSTIDEAKAKHIPWKIGAILNKGLAKFGDDYVQAVDPIKHKPGTYGNYMRIEAAFPEDKRPFKDKISFSHHAQVYTLNEADRDKLLSEAVEGSWSVSKLRDVVGERFPKQKRVRAKLEEIKEVDSKSHLQEAISLLEQVHRFYQVENHGLDALEESIREFLQEVGHEAQAL